MQRIKIKKMSTINFVKNNLISGLKKSPFNASLKSIYLVPFFFIISLPIGFYSGVLKYSPIISIKAVLYLPFTLLILPSIIAEVLFRGLLIPIDTDEKEGKEVVFRIILSTSLFVLWHPLNAVLNPVSAIFFLNPYFLLIVALLGVTCGVAYIYSKSLWVPIIIHWLTVIIWVLLLGGRNLILDS